MNDIIRMSRALDFAAKKHVDQKRKGEREERRREYVDWARRVVAGCRGVNRSLEAGFDDAANKLEKTFRRVRRLLQ